MSLAEEGGFLEWAEYSGNCYGTPRASVEREMAAGRQVILEIEVQGALQVREKMPEAHLVFIEPPSLEELERRLRGRGTETDDVVDMRMRTALVELSQKMEYDYAACERRFGRGHSPARALTSTKSPSNSKRISAL